LKESYEVKDTSNSSRIKENTGYRIKVKYTEPGKKPVVVSNEVFHPCGDLSTTLANTQVYFKISREGEKINIKDIDIRIPEPVEVNADVGELSARISYIDISGNLKREELVSLGPLSLVLGSTRVKSLEEYSYEPRGRAPSKSWKVLVQLIVSYLPRFKLKSISSMNKTL